MKTFGTVLMTGAAVAALIQAGPALAQDTDRPIRLIVPFLAGGPTDLLARMMGQKTGEVLGQTVIIDNRPGAGGTIGTDALAKAKPDGYTISLGSVGTHGINPALYSKLPYDPIRDFAPIVLLTASRNVIIVSADSPYHTLKDLVDAAKASPGKITMGSAGSGTSPHLSGVVFNMEAGLDTLHVPYKGSAAAQNDLIGGRVDYTFDGVSVALPLIKAGKVRPLAVTSGERTPVLPDVPTIAESGYPGFEVTSWGAFFAPAGTPREAIDRINAAANKALNEPQTRRQLEELSYLILGGTPEDAEAAVRREVARWPAIVEAAGARVD